jgi:hypothetical protein
MEPERDDQELNEIPMHHLKMANILASIVAVALVACGPTPAPTPLPPTETPIPTATALPTPALQASAWVSYDRVGEGSVQTVFAKLARGDQGVAHAQMYCIVHDTDASRRWPGTGFEATGEDGIASTSFIAMGNPEGAMVPVQVYLIYEEKTYQAETAFVSYC